MEEAPSIWVRPTPDVNAEVVEAKGDIPAQGPSGRGFIHCGATRMAIGVATQSTRRSQWVRVAPRFATAFKQEYGLRAKEVHHGPRRLPSDGRAGAVERYAAFDMRADLVGQFDKVSDRAQMDVGRVIPSEVEIGGFRHSAAQQ